MIGAFAGSLSAIGSHQRNLSGDNLFQDLIEISSQNFPLVVFIICVVWILIGMFWYSGRNGWTLYNSYFYTIDAGFSIGFGMITELDSNLMHTWTLIFILFGSSIVSGSLGALLSLYFNNRNQLKALEEQATEIEATSSPTSSRFKKLQQSIYSIIFLKHSLSKILFVCLFWTLLGCLYGMWFEKWNFITSLFFAVTSCSTAGLIGPPCMDPRTISSPQCDLGFFRAILAGTYVLIGVPVYAFTMSQLSRELVEFALDLHARKVFLEPVSLYEISSTIEILQPKKDSNPFPSIEFKNLSQQQPLSKKSPSIGDDIQSTSSFSSPNFSPLSPDISSLDSPSSETIHLQCDSISVSSTHSSNDSIPLPSQSSSPLPTTPSRPPSVLTKPLTCPEFVLMELMRLGATDPFQVLEIRNRFRDLDGENKGWIDEWDLERAGLLKSSSSSSLSPRGSKPSTNSSSSSSSSSSSKLKRGLSSHSLSSRGSPSSPSSPSSPLRNRPSSSSFFSSNFAFSGSISEDEQDDDEDDDEDDDDDDDDSEDEELGLMKDATESETEEGDGSGSGGERLLVHGSFRVQEEGSESSSGLSSSSTSFTPQYLCMSRERQREELQHLLLRNEKLFERMDKNIQKHQQQQNPPPPPFSPPPTPPPSESLTSTSTQPQHNKHRKQHNVRKSNRRRRRKRLKRQQKKEFLTLVCAPLVVFFRYLYNFFSFIRFYSQPITSYFPSLNSFKNCLSYSSMSDLRVMEKEQEKEMSAATHSSSTISSSPPSTITSSNSNGLSNGFTSQSPRQSTNSFTIAEKLYKFIMLMIVPTDTKKRDIEKDSSSHSLTSST